MEKDKNVENYLKSEFYSLVKTNSKIFDFIEAGSLDGVWYWDLEKPENGWMSPKFWETLGYDPSCKKNLASEWQNIIFNDDLKVSLENLKKHCEEPNYPYDQVVRYKHKDGSTVWVRCRGIAIRDENGKPIRLLGTHTDVTAIKEKEKNYDKLKNQMEIIFNGTHDSVALISVEENGEFRYNYVNKAFKNFFALDDSKINYKTPQEVFGKEYGNKFAETYKNCIESKEVFELEEEVITHNEKLYFQTTLTPVLENDGNRYIISSKKNITLQKNNEMLLRESEQKFKALTECSPDVIFTADRNKRVTYASKVLPGMKIGEIVRKDFISYISCKERDMVIEKIEKVFREKCYEECKIQLSGETDARKYYSVRIAPLEINRKIEEVIMVSTDITKEMKQQEEIKRWAEIFNSAEWGITAGAPDNNKFELANPAFAKMHGYSIDELMKLRIKDVFAPEVRGTLKEEFQKVHEKGNHVFESLHIRKDGTIFPVLINATAIKDENGRVMYRAVSVQDITQIKELEKKLREEQALFKTTLHSLGDAVISSDIYGNVSIMNETAEKLTGWSISEAKGLPFDSIFNIINEFTRGKIESPINKIFKIGEISELANDTLLIKKNGEEISIESSVAPIKDGLGNVRGAVTVFRDFTEKKQKQERIEYLSYHDQLTGLYNRRYFEEELKILDTEANIPLTIIMIDVNGLKLTNDAFGHQIGDKLLVSVARAMQEACREDEVIARIGGDEFIILLPNTDNISAEKVVKRVKSNIQQKNTLDNIIISVSMGWENKVSKEQRIEDIFAKADEYMYRKKLTESQAMRNDTIKMILNTLNETNKGERIHLERVNKIAMKIGKIMNLGNEELKDLGIVSIMHDIGNISVDRTILNKPSLLTETEYNEIKRHSETGYHILKSVNEYANIADHVLSHHERWDGKGYPRGLAGEEISLIARIIMVAGAFEAMTSERPYRKALSVEKAIEEMEKCSGTQFDPHIVELFKEHLWKGGVAYEI